MKQALHLFARTLRGKLPLFGLLFLATVFVAQAQPIVAFTGVTRTLSPDGFSFVAGEAIAGGTVIYFTDEEYRDVCNGFYFDATCVGQGEPFITYTAPGGGLAEGTVVFISETAANTFTVTGGGGTAVLGGTGGFSISATDALVAFSSSNASDPQSNVTEIYAVLKLGGAFTGGVTDGDNPAVDFPNAVVTILPVGFNDAEYNPALRSSAVTRADLEDISNWVDEDPDANLALSTVPFTGGVELVPSGPAFTAPADLCINAGVQTGQGGGTPTGGVYSGSGVTDDGNGMTYSFNPTAAGVGTHTITYTVGGMSAMDDIEVFALPTVTFTALADLCVNAGVQTGQGGGSPTGGVYSGSGVTDDGNGMTYSFDPAAAGVGTHTLTYTFTDSNGCTNSANDDVEVFAAPTAAFTALADLCINAGVQTGQGGGTPTGGVYSGPGVTDDGNGMTYSFDPAVAGVGTHTITYTITTNGCTDSATDDVEVFALPTVTFTAPNDLCVNAGVQTGQGGGTPTGGVYSGPGVTDDGNGMTYSFDPAAAGVGTHTLTYTFTDANACTNSASDGVEVFAIPTAAFTAPADLCVDAGVQAGLGGGTPTGGTYSGTGVTDDGNGMTYSFDPAAAGVGTHTITYTVGVSGCIDSAADDVEVFALPTVTFTAPADLCINAGVQASLGGGTPTGGTYSGPGVTDDGNGMTYSFDPAAAGVGTHTITYTFTDANGCSNSASDNVGVLALPVVAFTAPADLCLDAGVQTGQGGGTPPQGTITGDAGVYSGSGVTDDGNGMTYSFDPAAAGVGTHTLTYTYTDENGCTNSASDDVEVFALPTVTFTAPADLCIDAGVQVGLGAGTPNGGTYSGPGVSDDGNGETYSFDPAAAGVGTHTLTFTFNDANGCTNSATDDVEVFDLPVVSLSTALYYCVDAPIDNVTLVGGSPSGGVYSGPGVTDNGMGTGYMLDPNVGGPGTITITYTFTDANGCTNSANSNIDIIDCSVEITDPCACLDNATIIDLDNNTGGDDGQFSEIITIANATGAMLPPGQTWTITAATGAFDANNVPPIGTQSAGVPVAADGSVTLNYNAGDGTYELPFVHVDAQGYSISIEGPFPAGSPANETLTISNNCQYPNPVFDPTLPSTVSDDDPIIPLGGMDTNGSGADAVTFTVDGVVQTEFDPSQYAEGDHTVVMTFDGADDGNGGISPDGGTTPASPGCTQEVQQVIEVTVCDPPVLTCPADNFGLPEGCNVMVPAAATTFNIEGEGTPDPALPTVSADPCTPLVLTSADVIVDNGCIRTVTRTYTITDDRDQTSSCDQVFTFTVDTEMPTFSETLPTELTVECDAVPAAAEITATDNCVSFTPVLFINEIHYDNVGGDVGEFVEIAGTAGIDLADYDVYAYEAFDGAFDAQIALSGVLPNEGGSGFGALAFTRTELPSGFFENGDADAIALVERASNTVVDFISYEGTATATNGPAAGMTSMDIGVNEPSNTPVGLSLQLTGTMGCAAADFTWTGPADESPGLINAGQSFDVNACAADNTVEVIITEERVDGICANEYTLTRTYTATDACGNPATQVQTINVQDTTAPEFCEELPEAAIVIECDEDVPPAVTLTATDNCDLSGFTQIVWTNELHYDNFGTDEGEFIEIAGVAGTDLANYEIQLYNGNVNVMMLDETFALSGVIDNEACNLGALSFDIAGIMNGSPDGLALVDVRDGSVVEFISWEGTFTAMDGAANGMTSTDIGVAEPGEIGESLQLIGTGFDVTDFTWTGPTGTVESPGDLNEGQVVLGNLEVTLMETTVVGDCPQEAVITRVYTVADACGNPNSFTQTITIEDTTAPEPVCNTIRVFLSASGQYTLTQEDIDAIAAGSMDNCDADFTYEVDQTFFDCDDIDLEVGAIGGAEVELTVTDCVGNSDVCTAIVEIDDSAVPFEFGCIAELNVTLGDDCAVTITPDMVVTGFDDCIDSYNIMIDGVETDQAVGCGEHTYMIELVEDGEIVYTCWGTLFAEDKTAPEIDCPDDVDQVNVSFELQTLEGEIDGTEETIVLSDYSCFSNFFEPDAGDEYFYDLIEFTVSDDDVYNFALDADVGGTVISLFAGTFDEDNPCQNVLGGSDGAYAIVDFFGVQFASFFNQNLRVPLFLEAGRTYTLLVGSENEPTDYTLGVVSDNGNAINAAGISDPQGIDLLVDLYCEDVELIQFDAPQSWIVDADGNLNNNATRDTYFGGSQAALNAFLEQLSLTGVPTGTDNCGPSVITLVDVLEEAGDCGDLTITRTFTVSDRADGVCLTPTAPVLSATCEQVITFTRPSLQSSLFEPNPQLVIPPFTAVIECDEIFDTDGDVGGPDDNPTVQFTGQPFILTASGYIPLDPTYCNLGVSYSDEPRIEICEGTYSFRREFTFVNWCDPSENFVYDQYVKVGDFTGPEVNGNEDLEISTSPFDCVANFQIPALEVTDGNGCSEASSTSYTITDADGNFVATGNIADGDVIQLAVGTYTLERCAEDACGNETCVENEISIEDEIEPSAACDDELNVSIGGGDVANGIEGIARIFATSVDEGSYDNCGEVTLEVRRNYWRNETCDPSANRWSPWGDFVDFYCCDIDNEITIELRVTDESGNTNVCWLVVTPEDKLNPFCFAPNDVALDCNELPLTFPGDIEQAYDDDFAATSITMSALFGGATGTDNCAVDTIVERSPNLQINECGWGTITRRFEAWQVRPEGDVNGNGAIDIGEVFRSTNSCSQLITINEVHDFVIDFPEDAAADCGDPDVPTIITTANGCDVLSVNIGDPVIFAATGDECYKYSITYDVINWCVWDGEYEGLVLPRITEDDGESLPIDRAVEGNERPVVRVSSAMGTIDENCDGDDTDQNVGNIDEDDSDNIRYFVTIDRRHSDRDGDSSIPDTNYDNTSTNGDNCIPADQFGRRNYGRYIYTQFVKVYDSTAPVVTVGDFGGPTDNCPNLLPGQFGDDDGNCEEAVSIPFSVTDDCELFDGDGNLVVELVSAELDAFAVDANNDGEITSNEFVGDADAAGNIINNGDGTFVFAGTYPIITSAMGDNVYHAVRVLFRDGCGNLTSRIIVFDVVDCKGPAPICINGLTVTLMPQDDGGCAMAIWANDFEGSAIDDCTGQGPDLGPSGLPRVTKYAIYRATDAEAPGFVPNPIVTGLVLTEEDEGEVIVYIYAFDEEGNYDYCETYILVQSHTMCDDGTGTIAGVIATENTETVEGVEVSINGEMTDVMTTGTDGTYAFGGLPLGGDYTVTPYLNTNPLNGVTTFDLVKISKHILNVELLDGPYKRIAADANRSSTITTLDLIQIRKLILNVITEFPNNTSWRFVETAYAFPVPTNPWTEVFPELINENDLAADILDADFVAVKIGDVNASAQANALSQDERNLNGTFHLEVENESLKAGNVYTVAFTGTDMASIEGFQGTLQLNGAELIDIEYGVATAENFGLRYAGQGAITASWNGKATSENVLFSLVIRPSVDAELSEVISVSSRYTEAEAYNQEHTMHVGINFSNEDVAALGFEVYQNTPNPFSAETMIGFNIPEDAEVTLTISDASGRMLTLLNSDYAAGYNTLNITKEMIQGATGVLTYTVTAGDYTVTKKMIAVK